MKRLPTRLALAFAALNAVLLLVSFLLGWLPMGKQISNYGYDLLYSHVAPPPGPPQSVVLAIDERTLTEGGGMRRLRSILTRTLRALASAQPSVVAIDSILSDPGDAKEDNELAAAMKAIPKLVLAADIVPDQRQWEMPLPIFHGAAIGHVHADPDPQDGISREYPLEKAPDPLGTAGERNKPKHVRLWALAMETLRLQRKVRIEEIPPDEIVVGDLHIYTTREESGNILIRFRPDLPKLSVADLLADASKSAMLRGKPVFLGVTARTAARDRLLTPNANGEPTPGVEIHAQAFETLAAGKLLSPAKDSFTLLICLLIAALITSAFLFLRGWQTYAVAGAALLIAQMLPLAALRDDLVLPAFPVLATAWSCALASGLLEYFVVRRQLLRSELEKSRYQQAIHFVTHEMRTPLTAIQGSSELMGRYNLTEEKRRQMAQMINAESKRLARMITTFLSVERLNDGQVDLQSETLPIEELIDACVERARPLADRKKIRIETAYSEACAAIDRELMEYAVYNLITNAIKYSPSETTVRVDASVRDGKLRLAVTDQGMGMDAKELRNIFQKFYRTKGAEQSGEAGTGIGLSIVAQIVRRHGGKIEVSSTPGKGSCFTVVLPEAPCAGARPAPASVER